MWVTTLFDLTKRENTLSKADEITASPFSEHPTLTQAASLSPVHLSDLPGGLGSRVAALRVLPVCFLRTDCSSLCGSMWLLRAPPHLRHSTSPSSAPPFFHLSLPCLGFPALEHIVKLFSSQRIKGQVRDT